MERNKGGTKRNALVGKKSRNDKEETVTIGRERVEMDGEAEFTCKLRCHVFVVLSSVTITATFRWEVSGLIV